MAVSDPQNADTSSKENAGILHWIRSHSPEIIRNNAPRVSAGLKLIASCFMFSSKNKVFSIAGAGFIAAFSTIVLFGGKKTEAEKEKLRQESEAQGNDKPKGFIGDYFNKVLHPRKYPIEAGTGIAMISSMFWTASGLFGKGGFSPGRLAGGALSLASDANIVFTKEKIGEPKSNPYKEGSLKYYLTELRHRPVFLSSMFNIGSDIASIAGGGHEYSKGKEKNTLVVGSFLLAANIFQAIMVDKNDYNIEKKAASDSDVAEKKEAALPPPTPAMQIAGAGAPKDWSQRTKKSESGPLQAMQG